MASLKQPSPRPHAGCSVQVTPLGARALTPALDLSKRASTRSRRQTARAINRARRDIFRIYATSSVFIACWWAIMLLHACEVAYLAAMTWLYVWLMFFPENRANLLTNITFDVADSVLKWMVFAFTGVGVLHARAFVIKLSYSIVAQALTFESQDELFSPHKRWRRGITTKRCPNWLTLARNFERIWVTWIEAVFYIHGTCFDDFFFVREYLELVSQVYQARQMAELIATRWINNVFVGMLFLNSISTPLIHAMVPAQKAPLRRLLSLMCSAVLNFVTSVVVPLIIFVPYVHAYDQELKYFRPDLTLNDVWYARAVRENQLLFVTSHVDFVFTLTPHWSLYQCLVVSESLLRRRWSDAPGVAPVAAIVPIANHETHLHQSQPSYVVIKQGSSFDKVKDLLLHNLLWIIGLAVLIIHIAAQSPTVDSGCQLLSTPWFARKSSCVIMNVNCFRHQIVGTEQEIHDLLAKLHQDIVFQIIFSHCPRLQIPPVVRTFSRLSGIDLFNVTLEDWRQEASLHQDYHRYMNYVYFVRTNMSTIPPGLLDEHFPDVLEELFFHQTNLSSLPREVEQRWQQVTFFGFEFTAFNKFPRSLACLQPGFINFNANPIVSIDDDIFQNPELFSIRASNPGLRQLPSDTTGTLAGVYRVLIEHGELLDVPRYLREWFQSNANQGNEVEHSLFGNPYCNRTLSELEEQAYQARACQEDHHSAAGRLNYSQIALQRPL